MNQIIKNLASFSFIFAVMLALPVFVFAQETEGDIENAQPAVLLADVSVYNAEIFAEDGNSVTVTFDISNNAEVSQSDIKYGLDIVHVTEDGKVLVDSIVASEVISLQSKETRSFSVAYPVSPAMNGGYEIWAVAKLSSGITVGLGLAGSKTFTASSDYVEILSDSCVMKVEGDDESYNLRQGVDISVDENVLLACDVINHSESEVSVTSQFETRFRTMFGEVVDTPKASESFILEPGVKSTLEFSIPKPVEPQAYDVSLVLVDSVSGKAVSQKVVGHYVIQGVSATIQTATVDKDSYTAGETIVASFFWTPSADSFPDSRQGTGTPLSASLTMTVFDEVGNACSEAVKKDLGSIEELIEVSVVTNKDCASPQVSFIVTDNATGATLDSRTFKSPVPEKEEVVTEEVVMMEKETNPLLDLLVFGFFFLVCIAGFVYFVTRKNSAAKDAEKMPKEHGTGSDVLLKSLVMAIVLLGGMNVEAGKAEAATFFHTDSVYTVNLNKSSYSPGETITYSGSAFTTRCGNDAFSISIQARFQGKKNTFAYGQLRSPFASGSGSFTAPSVPGNYRIAFYGCNGGCRVYNYPFTVVAPQPMPDISATFNPTNTFVGGVSTVLSGDATNISTINTGSGFTDEFTYRYGTGGAWNTFPGNTVPNSALNPAAAANDSVAFTPPTAGNDLYLRYCVDEPSVINEGAGESNNCMVRGPFTVSSPPPSVSMSALGCNNIPAGSDECSGLVNWRFNYSESPYRARNMTTGSTIYNGPLAVNNNVPIVLKYGSNVITVDSEFGVVSDSKTVNAECASGLTWSSMTNLCEAAPTITIKADPNIIRSGDTSTVTVDVDSSSASVECNVINANPAGDFFVHNGVSSPIQSYNVITQPLTSALVVSVSCLDTLTGLTSSNEVRIDVIPTLEEV